MIELGKRDNGVTIFDNEKLVKVDITGRGNSDYLVYFDTRAYDELRGLYAGWFVYQMEIVRKINPELCVPFDDFFKNAFDLIVNNQEKFQIPTMYGSYGLLDSRGKDKYQINYPSDDTHVNDATFLKVTQYSALGYSLDFDKTTKDLTKLSFLLKYGASHFQELAWLYAELFAQINDMATKPYEECQEEFNQVLIKKRKERDDEFKNKLRE